MTLLEVLQHLGHEGGIAIGRCPARIHWDVTEYAHMHTRGKYRGWLCVEKPSSLLRGSPQVPNRMIHELAHFLIRPDDPAHGDAWQSKVRELGGRVERRYLRIAK